MNDKLFGVLVSSLLLSIAVGFKKDRLFAEHKPDDHLAHPERITSFCLDDLQSGDPYCFQTSRETELLTLFIPFSPSDCHLCFEDAAFWEALSDHFLGRVRVIGIISEKNPIAARFFVRSQSITIPVWHDPEHRFITENGFADSFLTPAMILVDDSGAVLDLSMSTYGDIGKQQKYLDEIQGIIDRSPSEQTVKR